MLNKRALAAASIAASTAAFGFDIRLDFTHDDYFTNSANPYGSTGQAALQAAADELSTLIQNQLSPIATNFVSGTSGSTTTQMLTNYSVVDPSTGTTNLSVSPVGLGDEIVVYIGAHSMGAFTFAEASPGVPSLQLGGSGLGPEWPAAMANAESQMNTLFGRGSAPLQRLTGAASLGGVEANYNLEFGPVMGSMWFNDSPGDSSPGRESWEENNAYWHFDHTTPVGTGKIDLYSLALHELIHILGYGTGDNWNDFVSGQNWSGPEATALLGTGEGVLDDDGFHILNGLQSTGYLDGQTRQTVMNGSPQVGQRDQLTLLDLAFLSDMGYQISPIPEPSTSVLLAMLTLSSLTRRSRS
ncbi:PEP-CTERM sorting domain-containing protein [Roseibacillus persicicus]|uniref:PEP-CTERM sorting domain-containing protein n=1 Tax=Roseibacillus persicicus TaxID=454148 RepID=UPI0028100E1D|nr:PEP-CTERM sorting domain-containing protein [Roseibacillus persicicus]MDQ8189942.1 PEP-CTERM sorting domain-containing protein [Roseibacillus persicicus]